MNAIQQQIVREETLRCFQSSRLWPSPKLLARLLERQHPELVSEVICLTPDELDVICGAATTNVPLCAAALWRH